MNNWMNKAVLIILIVVSLGFTGSAKDEEVKQKINEFVFSNTDCFKITTFIEDKYYCSDILAGELRSIKKDFEKLEVVKKYTTDLAPFGNFEDGYRALFIVEAHDHFARVILYSLSASMIIVRESDIDPNHKDSGDQITVYKCKIPQTATDLLAKHENEIPKGGNFISTFPPGKGVRGY